MSKTKEDRTRQLASAAEALFADYAAESELTAFSVLDGEGHCRSRTWLGTGGDNTPRWPL